MPTTVISMRALILLIIILYMQMAVVQAAVTNEQTIFTIEIHDSGNAVWIVEKHKPITTQSEIKEWESAIKNPGNFSYTKDTSFRDLINKSLRSAGNFSNRSMSIQNFNVSYDMVKTLPGGYVIIRFTFDWNNFSRIDSSKILVGDAFSEELIGKVPSSDNVIIIKIPAGYEVVNATPAFDKRDGNRLIWDGTLYRNFKKGEPSIVLSRTGAGELPVVQVILILVVLVSGGLFLLWIKKSPSSGSENNSVLDASENDVPQQAEKDEIKAETTEDRADLKTEIQRDQTEPTGMEIQKNNTVNPASLPDLTREILGDEEMIEQYLIKLGGQAYQSEIVKESGLSKSKISIVLAKMKDEGRILKIRKGKENIIRLVPKK